jgi:hypothetical protein
VAYEKRVQETIRSSASGQIDRPVHVTWISSGAFVISLYDYMTAVLFESLTLVALLRLGNRSLEDWSGHESLLKGTRPSESESSWGLPSVVYTCDFTPFSDTKTVAPT